MKITKILLLIILSSILIPAKALASGTEENEAVELETTVTVEDNVTKVSSKYFDLVLTRKSQLPFGKKVPYEIQITSHIDSPKTQIIWEIPSTLSISAKHSEFVSLQKDETKTFKASVTPERKGTYVVGVNVVSWQHDTNYTNSAEDTIEFDSNLVLQPVSTAYRVGNLLKIFLFLVGSIGLIYLAITASKSGVKYIKEWLTPPR